MKKIISFVFLLCTPLLSSCGNYLDQKQARPLVPAPVQNEQGEEVLVIEFATVKEAIFAPRCTSCHQQYDTYQGVVRELAAIQNSVQSNRMPKSGGPLTDNQKALLNAWIAQGAPQSTESRPTEPEQPEALAPTWKSLSENVLIPKCLVCHNPQGQAKFLDLSTRQAIFANRNQVFLDGSKLINLDQPEESYLVKIINDQDEPMPPPSSNIPRLTPQESNILTEWIRLGLP